MAERPFSEVSFSDRNLKVVNILASLTLSLRDTREVRYPGTR